MDKQVNFLLHIKLNSLRRDGLDSLTYKQLKRYVYETKWLVHMPESISIAAKDIQNLTINEVAGYLSVNDQKLQYDISKLAGELLEEDYHLLDDDDLQ